MGDVNSRSPPEVIARRESSYPKPAISIDVASVQETSKEEKEAEETGMKRTIGFLWYNHRAGGLQVPTTASMLLPLSSVTPSADTKARAGPFNVKSRFALK